MVRQQRVSSPGGYLARVKRWSVVAVVIAAVHGCRFEVTERPAADEDFLITGRTLSHFQAIQVDPRSEDSAGPQFVVAEDVNNDGFLDLVSAWNQSQPVQVHLQRRNDLGIISFETIILAGNVPVLTVAGLAVADLDRDGHQDVIVLVKHSALKEEGCLDDQVPEPGSVGAILTYFGPGDAAQTNQALAWQEVEIGPARLQGVGREVERPEDGGFSGMAVGDITLDGFIDIVVAWNTSCSAGSEEVLLLTNLGAAQARDGRWALEVIPDEFVKGTVVKDVALSDVDQDGDLDVIATFPDSPAMNIRWYRNPNVDIPDDFHLSDGKWQVGTVGQMATGADVLALADIDGDSLVDVLVRSTQGSIIQWLKAPPGPTTAPLRAIPWQVYTLAEFIERVPEAVALGDVNFDGRVELIAAAEGGLAMFGPSLTGSVYDQWRETLIVDDLPPGRPNQSPPTTDPSVEPEEVAGSTFINSILIADLDSNGSNDVVATLDRSGLSGLSNDALAWFRNLRRPAN